LEQSGSVGVNQDTRRKSKADPEELLTSPSSTNPSAKEPSSSSVSVHNASDSAGHVSLEFPPRTNWFSPLLAIIPLQGILEGNNPIARNLDAIACNVAGDNAIAIHLTPENIRIVAKNASVYNGIPDSAHHNAGAILTSHLNQQHHAI